MPLQKQFDGPERALLRAALVDAFPRPEDFTTFLSDSLNQHFIQIVPSGVSYVSQLESLLTKANGEVWIAKLVVAACQAVPNNPKLGVFALTHGFEPAEPGGEGWLTPKRCDRFYQVQDFTERFEAGIKGSPTLQKYLVFGEEYEAHRSLVQRLVDERIRPAAAERWGDTEGTVRVVEVLEWPAGGDPKVLQKRVRQTLHGASGSGAESATGAYQILAASPGFCEHKVLVVGQQIVLEEWDQGSADLLNWYLGEFWQMTLGPKDPAIVLLVQLECKEEMAAASGEGPCPKDQVLAALTSLTQPPAPAAPLVLEVPSPPILLDELVELREIDIRNWFVQFLADRAGPKLNPADEAKRVRQEAKQRRNGIRRTDDIERLLTEVYDQWTEQAGVGE
jgi:hypothetical protein